ncbi:MAG: putative Holliday junction resolvase [Candidatus Saccharibacteria bacterium]|nr:putative Holliday junction resolvase [Candidatus Saccharibacteria bacterium]
MPQATPKSVIALDVGTVRIGIATASYAARMPHPLTTIPNDVHAVDTIVQLLSDEGAAHVVVGLPRNLNGDDTQQTQSTRAFATHLASHITVPVHFQDEALTSVKAREELTARGKLFVKADVDALAATYILEDYLAEHGSTI